MRAVNSNNNPVTHAVPKRVVQETIDPKVPTVLRIVVPYHGQGTIQRPTEPRIRLDISCDREALPTLGTA